MARQKDSKNKLVKCEFCGEEYSVTYKHCPFCNGDGTGRWDELESMPEEERKEAERKEDEAAMRSGGRRMSGGGRRGPSVGKVIAIVVSLALIVAAVVIVVSIVRSILGGGQPAADPTPAPPETAPVVSQLPENTSAPTESAAPAVSPVPTPVPEVLDGRPTAFKLNRGDFTLAFQGETFQMEATFTPADQKARVVWKSGDEKIATVSADGLVTAVGPGMVTITATVDGAGTQECIVRCNFPAGSGDSTPSGGNTAGLALNREDFTLGHAGETWKLSVSGTSSPVVWAIGSSAVATIAGDGTVTAVAPGITTVTATVDGVSLKCTVRCTW